MRQVNLIAGDESVTILSPSIDLLLSAMMLFLTICAASAAARAAVGTPAAPLTVELFMDWQNDPEEPWGLMSGNPTSLLVRET